MNMIRLLIVEDDAETVKDWRRAIDLHNAEDEKYGYSIDVSFADSHDEANFLIADRNFDATVIDLRLRGPAGQQGHNQDGNKVAKQILETAVSLIAIYTGQPGEAEQFPESTQIKTFEKGEGLGPVLEWLRNGSSLVFQMQKSARSISTGMAGIFHGSIWPRWRLWMNGTPAPELHTALTRHMVSHMHASLLNSTGDKVHSEEWYFVPVAESMPITTGDLLSRAGQIEVVITPRCDMAREGKTKSVQLAVCESVAEIWRKSNAGEKKQIRQHSGKPVQHFLPPMRMTSGEERGPWFVRFDCITSLERTPGNLEALKTQRFATLTPEFLPSLVERLGAYFSRIGTSDVSE